MVSCMIFTVLLHYYFLLLYVSHSFYEKVNKVVQNKAIIPALIFPTSSPVTHRFAKNNYNNHHKEMCLEGFMKNLSRINVSDVGRNLVPDLWTTDGEDTLREVSPHPHDNSCVGCRETKLSASRFFTVKFHDVIKICQL